jgi:hypothetical protein
MTKQPTSKEDNMHVHLSREQAVRIAYECDQFDAHQIEVSGSEALGDKVVVPINEQGARLESFTVGIDGELT